MGTGNVSVSAAFYHGGRWVGLLAVFSEMFKGIAAVLLARYFFPFTPAWEIVALIALVSGRFGLGRGAGTTNVVWGYIAFDAIGAGLIALIGGIGFTLIRERQLGKLGVLALIPLITALRHPYDSPLIVATIFLSSLMALIYRQIPDDLDLPPESAQRDSQEVFQFFRGNSHQNPVMQHTLLSLNQPLAVNKVGQKAATLAQLKRWGYPVPMGWVLLPGDDPESLSGVLYPDAEHPLVVRSSAIGEDSETASAAGQYTSLLHITSQAALEQAILQCQMSYNFPAAIQYRQDQGIDESGMAVLAQVQVQGVFSGVVFSRDPVQREGDAVVIEALPGSTQQIVSGRVTPEQYRVWISTADLSTEIEMANSWILPDAVQFKLEGTGTIPPRLIQQVAYLARHLERRYHGIPQDIEWSYDGQQLWVLQSRPITTLLPIWTRKIAAEVIPGFIHPLTWSINRPLTCGVWGEIFTIVLGDRTVGLDFNETATLHHSSAYFNATLLGQIFLRMGLPPESLDFLTRGAKFSKPPLRSTLRNLPGLLRLAQRELRLEKDFQHDAKQYFEPAIAKLRHQPPDQLTPSELLSRIEHILDLLKRATYYSILSPLSFAVRQALFKVQDTELDSYYTPEVASLRALEAIAQQARHVLPELETNPSQTSDDVFAQLASSPDGQMILQQFDRFLAEYGYLSQVGTDIAIPRWREDPHPVQELLVQYLLSPTPVGAQVLTPSQNLQKRSKSPQVQRRLDLKGRVTKTYSQMLAELRWSFVALERAWIKDGLLQEGRDLFFLEFEEIQRLIANCDPDLKTHLLSVIERRKQKLEGDRQLIPSALVYGNNPPQPQTYSTPAFTPANQRWQGIAASPGQVEGEVLILLNLQSIPSITKQTILVVPYTDSGWSPLLARAGGIIAEVGGRLSHGAIIAREYGIPAVMDIHNATRQLKNGQRVRLDGEQGIVEIL
jgi:pyruvate,water dikinase